MLNALYGVLSNEWFRYYNDDLAESVTASGQLSIKWGQKYINDKLNTMFNTDDIDYVIAIDTDSIMVNMEAYANSLPKGLTKPEIVDRIDSFTKDVLQPYLDEVFDNLKNRMNAYKQAMSFKRECIGAGMFFAKKRYAILMYDLEGVRFETPKVKVTGLESKRSSTPKICRNALNKAYEIMLTKTNEDLYTFIDQFKEEYINLDFDKAAFPRGCGDIEKYTDSNGFPKNGTPQHIKAAIAYNQYIKEKKLDKKYQKISNDTKIRFIRLRMPNPTKSEVFAVPDTLPEEFGLDEYIDHYEQFQKSFLTPLENIAPIINWNTKKRLSASIFYKK